MAAPPATTAPPPRGRPLWSLPESETAGNAGSAKRQRPPERLPLLDNQRRQTLNELSQMIKVEFTQIINKCRKEGRPVVVTDGIELSRIKSGYHELFGRELDHKGTGVAKLSDVFKKFFSESLDMPMHGRHGLVLLPKEGIDYSPSDGELQQATAGTVALANVADGAEGERAAKRLKTSGDAAEVPSIVQTVDALDLLTNDPAGTAFYKHVARALLPARRDLLWLLQEQKLQPKMERVGKVAAAKVAASKLAPNPLGPDWLVAAAAKRAVRLDALVASFQASFPQFAGAGCIGSVDAAAAKLRSVAGVQEPIYVMEWVLDDLEGGECYYRLLPASVERRDVMQIISLHELLHDLTLEYDDRSFPTVFAPDFVSAFFKERTGSVFNPRPLGLDTFQEVIESPLFGDGFKVATAPNGTRHLTPLFDPIEHVRSVIASVMGELLTKQQMLGSFQVRDIEGARLEVIKRAFWSVHHYELANAKLGFSGLKALLESFNDLAVVRADDKGGPMLQPAPLLHLRLLLRTKLVGRPTLLDARGARNPAARREDGYDVRNILSDFEASFGYSLGCSLATLMALIRTLEDTCSILLGNGEHPVLFAPQPGAESSNTTQYMTKLRKRWQAARTLVTQPSPPTVMTPAVAPAGGTAAAAGTAARPAVAPAAGGPRPPAAGAPAAAAGGVTTRPPAPAGPAPHVGPAAGGRGGPRPPLVRPPGPVTGRPPFTAGPAGRGPGFRPQPPPGGFMGPTPPGRGGPVPPVRGPVPPPGAPVRGPVPPPVRGPVPPPGRGMPVPGRGIATPGRGMAGPGRGVAPPGRGAPPPGRGAPPPGGPPRAGPVPPPYVEEGYDYDGYDPVRGYAAGLTPRGPPQFARGYGTAVQIKDEYGAAYAGAAEGGYAADYDYAGAYAGAAEAEYAAAAAAERAAYAAAAAEHKYAAQLGAAAGGRGGYAGPYGAAAELDYAAFSLSGEPEYPEYGLSAAPASAANPRKRAAPPLDRLTERDAAYGMTADVVSPNTRRTGGAATAARRAEHTEERPARAAAAASRTAAADRNATGNGATAAAAAAGSRAAGQPAARAARPAAATIKGEAAAGSAQKRGRDTASGGAAPARQQGQQREQPREQQHREEQRPHRQQPAQQQRQPPSQQGQPRVAPQQQRPQREGARHEQQQQQQQGQQQGQQRPQREQQQGQQQQRPPQQRDQQQREQQGQQQQRRRPNGGAGAPPAAAPARDDNILEQVHAYIQNYPHIAADMLAQQHPQLGGVAGGALGALGDMGPPPSGLLSAAWYEQPLEGLPAGQFGGGLGGLGQPYELGPGGLGAMGGIGQFDMGIGASNPYASLGAPGGFGFGLEGADAGGMGLDMSAGQLGGYGAGAASAGFGAQAFGDGYGGGSMTGYGLGAPGPGGYGLGGGYDATASMTDTSGDAFGAALQQGSFASGGGGGAGGGGGPRAREY